MKTFLVILAGKQGALREGENWRSLLADHAAFLQNLHEEGHLLLAGPFVDDNRALFILRAYDEPHACGLVESDPFFQAGYYEKYTVAPFHHAHPENGWLVEGSLPSVAPF